MKTLNTKPDRKRTRRSRLVLDIVVMTLGGVIAVAGFGAAELSWLLATITGNPCGDYC